MYEAQTYNVILQRTLDRAPDHWTKGHLPFCTIHPPP